jgi:hypothetical protein
LVIPLLQASKPSAFDATGRECAVVCFRISRS